MFQNFTISIGLIIEAEWRIYASVIKAIIGSDIGLSPDRGQARTNDILSIINDKKGVQFICVLLTCCVTFLSVYITQWCEN